MNSQNLIRIENQDLPIFRIFKINRVEQLFSEKRLILVKPKQWEDPFENFLLKCKVVTPDGEIGSLEEIANSWYGLCWTLNSDSDAMWRIYSPNKDGIRIKTTINKLANALWETTNGANIIKYFIGKVEYRTRQDIENFLTKTSFQDMTLGGDNKKLAETLLIKRTAFEHENEVRMLANDLGPSNPDPRVEDDLYKIPIDPNDFIEEMCIDPRLNDKEVLSVENRICQFGYKGKIIQSDLYRLGEITIKLCDD